MENNGSSKGISLAYFIYLYVPLAPHFSAMCVPSRCSAIFTPLIVQLYESPHCSVVYPLVAQLCLPHSLLSYMKPLIVQLFCTPPHCSSMCIPSLLRFVCSCVSPHCSTICIPLITQLCVHPLITQMCAYPH